MADRWKSDTSRRRLDLGAGVLAMSVSFFIWLALSRQFDLSYLYPFEGLDRVLLAFAAWLILKEKMSTDLWIGLVLICLGAVFVAGSCSRSIHRGSPESPRYAKSEGTSSRRARLSNQPSFVTVYPSSSGTTVAQLEQAKGLE